MTESQDRRYSIREVSEIVDVPQHLLRQWEDRFSQLKPARDRARRRYYTQGDIDIARRIKQLIRHEKLTTEGARKRLAQELRGEGRPRTRREAVELIDKIEAEVRDMLDLLGSDS